MVLSMTGYGKGEAASKNQTIIAEIKSLNSKNLDITTHIPSTLMDKDLTLRQMVASQVLRGKVDLTITVKSSSSMPNAEGSMLNVQCSMLNAPALSSYVSQIKSASQELGISEPQDWWSVLCRMPGVMQTEAAKTETTDEEWEAVSKAVSDALHSLTAFRRQEGEAVQKKFEEKIHNIAALLKEVEQYETQRTDKIRQQIIDRLDSLKIDYSNNRLEEEMIYYIEKLDVNEEKQRLTNHLKYFCDTMAQPEPQGKKLGFIAQEIGREINTLGSKSNHAEMQKIVVRMKDELEQIKEQVLNVL